MTTKIEWTEKTWNPITGCSKISPGCDNCYAERMSKRLAGRCGYDAERPFKVTYHPEKLEQPIKWRKPSMIFACSMGDLFHVDTPIEFIDAVFATMAIANQHTYQLLTKRPRLARSYLMDPGTPERIRLACHQPVDIDTLLQWKWQWPLPNVWLGVTAENQEPADKRIPVLLDTPAAVRFVSVEPMLEAINLKLTYTAPFFNSGDMTYRKPIDWVICGGETGPGARPMSVEWARDLRGQCYAAHVPFFFKKVGGGRETPEDLLVRQWPEAHDAD